MTYELCSPDTVSIEPKTSDAMTSLRERVEHAKTLGLTAQAAFLERELRHDEKRPKEINPLTADELAVWGEWLPTRYLDDQHCPDGLGPQKMSSYMFDHIPSPVLKLWTRLKEQGVFDYYEIWTPEKLKTDPILIGVLGNERYLLARWGESDANFLNFEDIAKRLWDSGRSRMDGWVDFESVYMEVFFSRLGVIGATVLAVLLIWEAVFGFNIYGGLIVFLAIIGIIVATFVTTSLWMSGEKCEQSFINQLFALTPQKNERRFEGTEYLRAICRFSGKTPSSK